MLMYIMCGNSADLLFLKGLCCLSLNELSLLSDVFGMDLGFFCWIFIQLTGIEGCLCVCVHWVRKMHFKDACA